MSSVNKVHILGNVGKDPEVRYTPSGAAVCNISVATSRKWTNKETKEKQEETEWHRLAFYDRLAEVAGQYVKKGSSIYVEGRLKTRKWQDKEGKDMYTTEVIVGELQLLGDRKQGDAPAAPAARPASTQRPQQREAPSTGFDNMDDDIPF